MSDGPRSGGPRDQAGTSGTAPAGLAPGSPEPESPEPGGLASGGPASGGARPAPRGRPRRRTRWRTAFFALAGVAIVTGVGWALLGNRLLVVRSVSVTGTHLVAPAQVIAAAGVPVGTPLLSVDAGSVARRVEAIRQVASVAVSKNWPDHLVIAVTERVPAMAVKMAGGGYDQVDKTGVIVRWTKDRPALPLLAASVTGSALAGNPEVGAVAGVLAELQPWLAKQVSGVKAATVAAGTEQVTLSLRDGKTVQWGSTDNAAQKNRELAVLLPGGARYIDVSAPGTAVTRLFSTARAAKCAPISSPGRVKCLGPRARERGFLRCGARHGLTGSVAS
ncbi:MAG TPA: FtsQ-type POTRA domain-containing protein [Trebonia sp.]|nr:FtsQ-type POTRA domain-containing protein [Trebonia sp.]